MAITSRTHRSAWGHAEQVPKRHPSLRGAGIQRRGYRPAMRARWLLAAGGGLFVLAAVVAMLPLHDGYGSCGNVFNAKTVPNGTRFDSGGPVNICAQTTVHTRVVEVVALLVLGGCAAALGVFAARR